MTHLDNNLTAQKRYLYNQGYKMSYINKLSSKSIYALYRKCEKNKKNC